MLTIKQIDNSPIDSNCFIIFDKAKDNSCLIIDPGSDDNYHLYEYLEHMGLVPQYAILTHEHFDHCWGVNDLRIKNPKMKLVCSSECSIAIQDKKKNYSVFYQQPGFELKVADIVLENIEWKLYWNGYQLDFYPAQGHSASGVMFTIEKYVFTGDELIKGIKTVTKLKTGSKEKLRDSLKLLERLKGNELIVCPGHGETFELDKYKIVE